MDRQNDIPSRSETGSLGVMFADKPAKETIELVANKLAIIADELNQSYELPCNSGVKVAKARLCAWLPDYADIFVLLRKMSS